MIIHCRSITMNSDLNLDIDSYSLDDILSLFKLGSDFNEQGLRQARKTVLGTHPDKSGLDKEYFLFFTKAYKILHSVHEFRTRSNGCVSTEYVAEEEDDGPPMLGDMENEESMMLIDEITGEASVFDENIDYQAKIFEAEEKLGEATSAKMRVDEAVTSRPSSF